MPITDDEEDEYKSEDLGGNDAEISKYLISIVIENLGSLNLNTSKLHPLF
jgi:hypothetical protein